MGRGVYWVLLVCMATSSHPLPSDTQVDASQLTEFLKFYNEQNEVIGDLTTVVENQTSILQQTKEELKEQAETVLKAVYASGKPIDCRFWHNLGYTESTVYRIFPLGESEDGVEAWCDMENRVVRKPRPRSRDCMVLHNLGYRESTVYTIFPMDDSEEGVDVWCDMSTDEGGWTVVFSRKKQDEPLDFAQPWRAYADGFGAASNEYWLGNQYFHALTKDNPQRMMLEVQNMTGDMHFAEWSYFTVGDEATKFTLEVKNYDYGRSTLGNVFSYYKPNKFSTRDQHNTESAGNYCDDKGHGGWWWYAEYCGSITPTAPFSSDNEAGYREAEVNNWNTHEYGSKAAIRAVRMKIRGI